MSPRLAFAVVGATFVLSASTVWYAVDPQATLAPTVGTALFLALAAAAALGRPVWPEVRTGGSARRGAIALAISAVVIAVASRHTIVASASLAPDDVAAGVAVIGLAAIAFSRPSRLAYALAVALVLGAYVLIGATLIAGSPYGNDAVASAHRAAELLLAGQDPYRDFDTVEALARFGLGPELATHLVSGEPLRSFSYPALSFLVPAPLIAAGLTDVRVLYLGLLVALALLLVLRLPPDLRPLGPAAIAANDAATRQHVAAGVDPAWAVLMAAALALVRHRWRSAALVGLACAARQQAWLLTPFYVAAVAAQYGPREAGKRAAIAAASFALPNAAFLLTAPGAWLGGVTAPLLQPLEPHGVGLVRLGIEGVIPLLPRTAYGVLALAGAASLLIALGRRGPGPLTPIAPLAALWLAWRSLLSSFALAGTLALAADVPLRAREEVSGAAGSGADGDPGLSGGSRGAR